MFFTQTLTAYFWDGARYSKKKKKKQKQKQKQTNKQTNKQKNNNWQPYGAQLLMLLCI